jgi:hypothetical protein
MSSIRSAIASASTNLSSRTTEKCLKTVGGNEIQPSGGALINNRQHRLQFEWREVAFAIARIGALSLYRIHIKMNPRFHCGCQYEWGNQTTGNFLLLGMV